MVSPFLRVTKTQLEHPNGKHPSEFHTHEVYEIFALISGSTDYYVEGVIYNLRPGDILITKRNEAHFMQINPCSEYCQSVVRFNAAALMGNSAAELQEFLDSRPLGQFNCFPKAIFKDTKWLYYLEKMYEYKDAPDYCQIYLTVLLHELRNAYPQIAQPGNLCQDLLSQILTYINNNLSQPLSVEHICQQFFISRAQLNRMFRKMTSCSVWDYVVVKRLLYAKALLESGETPASACAKCGFNDYSPFFRAYKAQFGVSPKAHKGKGPPVYIDPLSNTSSPGNYNTLRLPRKTNESSQP